VGDLAGLFMAWVNERGEGAHTRSESEELTAALTAGQPFARFLMWLDRDRLAALVEPAGADHEERGKQAFEALTPEQQAGVRAQWEARPRLFVPRNLLAVLTRVRKLEVGERLEALAVALEEHLKTEEGAAAPRSPDQALEAYSTVRAAKRVRLEILRRGEPQVLELEIR
jgi:hypothetical protein